MFLNGASDIMGLFSSMISGSSAQKYLCRKTGGVGLAVGRCLCLPGYQCILIEIQVTRSTTALFFPQKILSELSSVLDTKNLTQVVRNSIDKILGDEEYTKADLCASVKNLCGDSVASNKYLRVPKSFMALSGVILLVLDE